MCDYLQKYPSLNKATIRKRCIARISTLNRMIDSSNRNKDEEKKLRKEILRYKSVIFDKKASLRDKPSLCFLLFGVPIYRLCWNFYKKMTERM